MTEYKSREEHIVAVMDRWGAELGIRASDEELREKCRSAQVRMEDSLNDQTLSAFCRALHEEMDAAFRRITEANMLAWFGEPMWIEGGTIIASGGGGAPRYETLHHPDGSSVRVMMGTDAPMNGGPAAKGLYDTPTPMLPPRPEPKSPTPGTPCYRCGAQAVLFRHGVPECAPGHAKKYKTPEKST